MRTRTKATIGFALALGALAIFLPGYLRDREVAALVDRNVTARGGEAAWRRVEALRLTGSMDVGNDVRVPYVLEQKRPDKMCLQFEFDGATARQCTDGDTGWKIEPYRGHASPQPMTATEVREVADLADPYGLLFDYRRRGHEVKLLGRVPVDGRDAYELEVRLPHGGVRWVYLDVETALERKVAAMRERGGYARRVETEYHDWKGVDGLLVPRRQETRTEGAKAPHTLTVATVQVNPPIDDARFRLPAGAGASARAEAGDPPSTPARASP